MYTLLNVEKREICLVTVLAGEWADEIQCEPSVVSLTDSPSYEVSDIR